MEDNHRSGPLRDAQSALDSETQSQIYQELKRLAARELRRHVRRATLDTTSLVHEAYAKLADSDRSVPLDRDHFLRLAARAMRQVIVDAARARLADKRGGGIAHVGLEEAALLPGTHADELLALDAALTALERSDPRAAEVVECHVFGGMSLADVAAAMGVAESTARRDFAYARALLAEGLSGTGAD